MLHIRHLYHILLVFLLLSCRAHHDSPREFGQAQLLPVGISFDFGAVTPSLDFLRGQPSGLERLLKTRGAAYILHRQKQMTGKAPNGPQFFSKRLSALKANGEIIQKIERNRNFARKCVESSRLLVGEALRYLPADFRFAGTLYFTVGYDIGTAWYPNGSINLAHKGFLQNPREISYYIIHELHHIGFMKYNPMPDLKTLKRASDLANLVRFAAHMEGMGVYAPWELRRQRGHLNDPDYRTLADTTARKKAVDRFFVIFDDLVKRGAQPVTPRELAYLEELSGKGRLWYIAGAHMAQAIEKDLGVPALRNLVKSGPKAFFRAYFVTEGKEVVSLEPPPTLAKGEKYGVLIQGSQIVLPGRIDFSDPKGTTLTADSQALLRGLLPFFRESIKTAKLEIRVHCSGKFSASPALVPMLIHGMCRRRGRAVKQFL
ncbi:hypothetical protein KJ865_11510, partial [Myxococcota bacterium]|nr:hypothetical protein [Myxococcota bacterium]